MWEHVVVHRWRHHDATSLAIGESAKRSTRAAAHRALAAEPTTAMEVRGGRPALDEKSATIEPPFEAPTRPLRTRFEPASAAQASARLTSPITAPGFAPIPVGRSPAVL